MWRKITIGMLALVAACLFLVPACGGGGGSGGGGDDTGETTTNGGAATPTAMLKGTWSGSVFYFTVSQYSKLTLTLTQSGDKISGTGVITIGAQDVNGVAFGTVSNPNGPGNIDFYFIFTFSNIEYTYTFTGTYNATTIEGTWSYPSDFGTYKLTKQ